MAECYNKIWIEKSKIMVDCGKCLNCRQNKKREYGIRMVHASEGKKNIYFATLTYNKENIPDYYSVSEKDARDYIKRVRQQMRRNGIKEKLQYFLGAEYGTQKGRPHYHLTLASDYDVGDIIKSKWNKGEVQLQIGTNASTFYTVGYSDKKFGIDDWKYNEKTKREKPFHKFTRGLGKEWIEKNATKINKENYHLNTNYGRQRLPLYYKKKKEEIDPLSNIDKIELKAEAKIRNAKELLYLASKYGNGASDVVEYESVVERKDGKLELITQYALSEEVHRAVSRKRKQLKDIALKKIELRHEKRKDVWEVLQNEFN